MSKYIVLMQIYDDDRKYVIPIREGLRRDGYCPVIITEFNSEDDAALRIENDNTLNAHSYQIVKLQF